MRSRSPFLPLLFLATFLTAFGCGTAETPDAGSSGGDGDGSSPKLFDISFGPTYTVSAFDVVPGCDPLETGEFKSTIGASVNGGSTRRLGQFSLELVSNGSSDLGMNKLIRVDEGDELCVFSIETAELNPTGSQNLDEDEVCVTIASDTTSLDFQLRMENGCALEVAVQALAEETSEGEVFQPVDALASSSFSPLVPSNLIDGSELSGVGPVKYQTHTNGANAEGMWHVASVAGNPPDVNIQWLVFDLGANRDLGGAYIWNLNQFEHTDRGVRHFEIRVSSDSDPGTAAWTSLGVFELDQACDCSTETSQFVDFESLDARLVNFRFVSTWSGRMAGGTAREYVGLSEVAFVSTE
jgi:hypothetical protein